VESTRHGRLLSRSKQPKQKRVIGGPPHMHVRVMHSSIKGVAAAAVILMILIAVTSAVIAVSWLSPSVPLPPTASASTCPFPNNCSDHCVVVDSATHTYECYCSPGRRSNAEPYSRKCQPIRTCSLEMTTFLCNNTGVRISGAACLHDSQCASSACRGGFCCAPEVVAGGAPPCAYCDLEYGKCAAATHTEWVAKLFSPEEIVKHAAFLSVRNSHAPVHAAHDDLTPLRALLAAMRREGVFPSEAQTVVAAIADEGVIREVLNWWCSLQRLGVANYVVIATSKEMYRRLTQLGIRSIMVQLEHIPNPGGMTPDHPGVPSSTATVPILRFATNLTDMVEESSLRTWSQRAMVKPRVALALAQAGATSIISDVDVVWLADVRAELESLDTSFDLYGMSDVPCYAENSNGRRDINTGFLFIRPNPAVVSMFEAVTSAPPADDQDLINYYSRSAGLASMGRLPCLDYACGVLLYRQRHPPCRPVGCDYKEDTSWKVVHFNYLRSEAKVPMMKAMGMWFLQPGTESILEGGHGTAEEPWTTTESFRRICQGYPVARSPNVGPLRV